MKNILIIFVVVLMYAIQVESGDCPYSGLVCGSVMGPPYIEDAVYYCQSKNAVPIYLINCVNNSQVCKRNGIGYDCCTATNSNRTNHRSCESLRIEISSPLPNCTNGTGDCPYNGTVCGWVLGPNYVFDGVYNCTAKCAVPTQILSCLNCCNRGTVAFPPGPPGPPCTFYDTCAASNSTCLNRTCKGLKYQVPCKTCC